MSKPHVRDHAYDGYVGEVRQSWVGGFDSVHERVAAAQASQLQDSATIMEFSITRPGALFKVTGRIRASGRHRSLAEILIHMFVLAFVGDSALSFRVFDYAVQLIAIPLVYQSARRLCGPGGASLAAVLYAATYVAGGYCRWAAGFLCCDSAAGWYAGS